MPLSVPKILFLIYLQRGTRSIASGSEHGAQPQLTQQRGTSHSEFRQPDRFVAGNDRPEKKLYSTVGTGTVFFSTRCQYIET
jgi:hypothetical protein